MASLRIKELCKEKHITMKELAERLGVSLVALSQSVNGNPTLSRLQEVADALGVDILDLFERQTNHIYGCLYVNNTPVLVNGKEEIESLLKG